MSPTQYTGTAALRGGGVVKVRPIRPDDEPRMVQFHRTLSDESVFYRYFGTIKLDARVAHDRLLRICFIDSDREMALVAERTPAGGDPPEIVAVARLTRLEGTDDAEFALLVSDAMQRQGLGRAMLQRLFDVGRDWGLERIVAEILPGNGPMRRICKSLGFVFEGETRASKVLGPRSVRTKSP
jgi:acetyltransferase